MKHLVRYNPAHTLSPAMRAVAPLLLCFLLVSRLIPLPAETARMPLDEIRAGMVGTGITVFQGTTREQFNVEILGVLTNVMGPQRDLIVARLTGGPLAQTGVIQGMSGSPIYIDERLIGAVSYSLGSFSTDTIAGITPIEEMVATDRHAGSVARSRPQIQQLPTSEHEIPTLVRRVVNLARPFAHRPTDVRALSGLQLTDARRLGPLLQPIGTPLILSGFTPDLQRILLSAFNSGGLTAAVGGVMIGENQTDGAVELLQAGDAIGASLIRGDLTMAGTGTVTMVDGNRVYAFGHPFYNLGPSRFPMTRAHITTLLPSLAISSKLASIGEVLGTIDQDRSTGIYGSFGPGPTMVPVRMSFESADRALQQTFNFEIIEDTIFTPLLTFTIALNTFSTWARNVGPSTFEISTTAHIKDHADIQFDDIYSGESAAVLAASSIANPLVSLFQSELGAVEIERIDVSVSTVEESRRATLERAWINTTQLRAGSEAELKLVIKGSDGEELVETVAVQIPNYATGTLTIEVSDAPTLTALESQSGNGLTNAETLDQLIRQLNRMRRNNRLYVRLLQSQPGVSDRGEALPALPASVLAVVEGNQQGGVVGRLREVVLGEWELLGDYSVSGNRRLPFSLDK